MPWTNFVGTALPTGWRVINQRPADPNDTGGCFSVTFLVEKNGRQAFMKAFDIQRLLLNANGNTVRIAQELASINFEKELLDLCRRANTKSVVVAIDEGTVTVPGVNADQPIQYLIFDLATQDARRYHNYRTNVDHLANLTILRHVTNGLRELHNLAIAHQDLKPSNVLLYDDQSSRVADLGRSSHRDKPIWHDANDFAGDRGYAPIEIHYRQNNQNWYVKRLGGDLYMLGSFAVFLFTGTSLTSQIATKLDQRFHPGTWGDTYQAVIPYIRAALRDALDTHTCFKGRTGSEIEMVIRQLCDPDPESRGNPRVTNIPQRYALQRYASLFERMAMQVRLRGTLA